MGVATIRFDSRFESIIQKDLKEFNYSTKTEYIRQAVRELHNRLRAENAISELAKAKGFAKKAGIKEQAGARYEQLRQQAAQELFNELKSLQAKRP